MIKQPSYRFAGYTESWTEKKLGEVSTHRGGTSIEKYFAENGVYKVISIGSYGLDGEYIDQGIRAISNEVTDKKIVRENELTMVLNDKTSNGTIIGRTLLIKSSNEFVVNQRTEIISPKEMLDSRYAYVLLNGNFREQVKKIVQGGTQIYVNYSSVEQLKLPLPSLTEQTAIGSFFQDIDQLISLQQRKLEVLKEQKKTYLKLLFPAKGQTKPALRFAGFEDDWKEVKLGEVLKKNNKKNRDLAINNVESVSNKLGFVKQTEQFEDYSVASADLSNYYVISEKQFAYNPSRINVGSIAYKKEGDTLSVVSSLYISFSTVENIDDSYLWYWFKTSLFDSQRAIYSEGGVRDTLSFNQLSDIELIFPSLREQQAIGSFFQDLDMAIAKQEEKVNQLKESKQTLLRKMFI